MYTESHWVSMKYFTVQLFELYLRKSAIASNKKHGVQHLFLEILIEREEFSLVQHVNA